MEVSEVVQALSRFEVMLSTPVLPNGQSPLEERLSLLTITLIFVKVGQSIERKGEERVLGPQCLLSNGQSSLVELLSLLVLALFFIKVSQSIEREGEERMLGPQCLLSNVQ